MSLGCYSNRVSHSAAVSLVTLTLTVCFPSLLFHLTVPLNPPTTQTHMPTHALSIPANRFVIPACVHVLRAGE